MVTIFVFILNKSKLALRPNCSDDPKEVQTLIRDRWKEVLDTQRHHFVVNDQFNNTYSFSKILTQHNKDLVQTPSPSNRLAIVTNADQQPNFDSVLWRMMKIRKWCIDTMA